MGARAESLAKKYEAKAAELAATIQKLSDADWKKVTAAEKWPVGVTAHHVAGGHEPINWGGGVADGLIELMGNSAMAQAGPIAAWAV